MDVRFPKDSNFHYYDIHVKYVQNIFKHDQRVHLIMDDIPFDLGQTAFRCYINNKPVIFSFTDDPNLFDASGVSPLDDIDNIHIFKFHYINNKQSNVFPFAPVSFYDWNQYFNFSSALQYNANGLIRSNQSIYGNATSRRKQVQTVLKECYGDKFDNRLTDQAEYWKKINSTLVAVFVPGYCNNMLDRGQLQYMMFGCCCISPYLPETLPYNTTLIPGIDYVVCNDDYSNLIEKIEWVKANRDEAIAIGNNAKYKLLSCCTPKALVDWVERNVG